MASFQQVTSGYLNQCCPRSAIAYMASLISYDITELGRHCSLLKKLLVAKYAQSHYKLGVTATVSYLGKYYRKTSSISRTKSQCLNGSCILAQLSSLIPLKPGVKLRISEDVVGAAPTGDAPTTSELSTILLPTKVRLILEVLWYFQEWLIPFIKVTWETEIQGVLSV